MSLAIDIDKVTNVLLADGWHEVVDDSFTLDAYEFVWDVAQPDGNPQTELYFGGHRVPGFEFHDRETASWFAGPLASIIAVRRTP